MSDLIGELTLIFQRLNLLSVIDLLLVTAVFFVILRIVRDTQAMALLRGIIFVVIVLSLLISLVNLPAFSWLVRTTLPALVFAIPVIFAPEIRRGLERLGRAGTSSTPLMIFRPVPTSQAFEETVRAVVSAAGRLSARQHGALIILERADNLRDYVQTGVRLDAAVTPELLLQVFYPNTPLHDGAVIISENKLLAAGCVMPLSASGVLARSPERHQMGLRHRAALGISEASDAIAVVVSEETGSISIAHSGRIIRRLDPDRLENILTAFYRPAIPTTTVGTFWQKLLTRPKRHREDGV